MVYTCYWTAPQSSCVAFVIFFFKQKTAYEVRISDWSSDVCSSDLGNYRKLARDAFLDLLPAELSRPQQRSYLAMLSSGAPYLLRDRVMADPSLVCQTMTISAPLAVPIDQFHKGLLPRDVPEDQRRVRDAHIGYYDQVVACGLLSAPLNRTERRSVGKE